MQETLLPTERSFMLELEDGAYSSLHTDKAYDLDITGFTSKTAEGLATHIDDAVHGTQSVVQRAYPNRLVMTKDQYDLLTGNPQLMQIGDVGQEFWLYRTKYNVMEIEVKE